MTKMLRALTALIVASYLIVATQAVSALQTPETTEAADEARERKVMERFLAVLEKTPRRGTALDRVYGYNVERGTIDAFIKTYKTKVAADPKDGVSWLLIGLTEAQRGRDAAAVEAFRQAESSRPDDALPSFYLGQALVLVGQPEAAIEAFERALTRKPARADLLDVYQALGRVHQRAHRNDQALAVWDRLEKAFPDDPRVQDQIAHALAEEGQDAAALIRFEALAKSTKDRFRQVQFAIEAAELKVRLGKGPEALADFESLLAKLDSESWLGREVRRKVEDVFLRTDDLAGLATYYENWLKKAPDDVEAMARLGRTLAGEGRLADARKWLEEAVKRAPSRRELRLALIEQFVQDRKIAEAASQYEALAKLEPNNPDVIRDWGRLLLRDTSKPEADRKQAAAAIWRKLAPSEAKDPLLVAQAAELFRQAGLSDEAISLYQRAIKLAPDSTQYREYLGEYFHSLKRPADALATWRGGVGANSKNARTLGRLGEVLAGFGYLNEALEPLTEACRLEPDDFDLRLKLADLKLALDKPLEALVELEKAEKAASADEQTEAVVDRLIQTYQTSKTLATTIDSLRKSLVQNPSASGWTRLARLLEADQKVAEAARAITEATKLDPKSVAAWVTTARLRESAGDLLGSAEALRTLTKLDRRSRTDYLTGIAKLEARLGRKASALAAGRELLAAAPGNPDHHQFFAELCFQLGEPDEGLNALRRASRANPSDPKAMLTLAENLARQFKSEEAIELYWRAFAKTLDIEAKLSIVGRMADQYLQRNQLDRLLARLERELREPNQQRELALCLAQAHATSGDYSTARSELERLLATNPRDAALLTQLSNLAEQEGDLNTAAKYQKQALDIAPNPEANSRLAQLYLDSGEITEAEAVWSKLANDAEDPARILSALDRLISHGKSETALAITERLLVKKPGDWEALYREGVALEALGKRSEASKRFRTLLDLKLEDEVSLLARPKSKNSGPNSAKPSATLSSTFPIEARISATWKIRQATRLEDPQYLYNQGNGASLWSPPEYGQARMAAIAWLKTIANHENQEDALTEGFRQARDKAGADPRPRWDWYYLNLIKGEAPETFEAARDLAKALPGDPSADYAYLVSLASRASKNQPMIRFRRRGNNTNSQPADKTPPLSPEDLDLALNGYRNLRKKKPEIAPGTLMTILTTELKRARREAEIEPFYQESVASANDPAALEAAITFAAERGKVDDFLSLEARAERLSAKQPQGVSSGFQTERGEAFGIAMNQRAEAKAYGDVLRILDSYLDSIRKPDAIANRALVRSSNLAIGMNQQNYRVRVGKTSRYVAIDYPQPNDYYDADAIQVLRNAYELYKHDDVLSDLIAHLQGQSEKLPEAERVYPILAMGYLAWWNDDKEEAIDFFRRAVELAKGDVELRLGLAEIQARRGEAIEALELVESVDPLDQKTMQRREVMALRLAVLSGNVDRARKASERLFGLRLDAETQMQLASQMSQLGMHELADTVLSRVHRKTGSNQGTLQALMLQYQQTGKTDQAFQIAGQILRSTANRQGSSSMNPNNNRYNEDQAARNEAIAVFARSGKLKELIERAEAQLAASPGSVQILQTLAEYYQADAQPEKVKETYDRLAKLRPDDAGLHYQIANQMFQAGNPAGAIEHYAAAFKKEPATYLNRYYEIYNAFQQAGKLDELGKLFDSLEAKQFAANPYVAQSLVAVLSQDEKTRESGMRLFRKVWKAYPDLRANIILQLNIDALAKSPEIYDYLREAVIPSVGKTKVTPWSGFDANLSWDNQGQIIGTVGKLLDTAARQNSLEALAREVDDAIKRLPAWAGGRALKGMVQIRRGKVAEARATLEELFAKEQEIPPFTRLLIGQEMENIKSLLDLQVKLYEGAGDFDSRQINFQQAPAGRLVTILHRAGKDAEAREKILDFSRKRVEAEPTDDDDDSEAYQRLVERMGFAQQMQEIGYPADALRFYEEILADTESMDAVRQMTGGTDQYFFQIRQMIEQTIVSLTEKNLGATLQALASPIAPLNPKSPGKPVTTPVDLVLMISPAGFDKATVTSLYGELLLKAVTLKKPELLDPVKAILDRRTEADSKDVSATIARCLVAIVEGKREEIARTSSRLIEVLNLLPLDPLAPGARPNARQRADAAAQLGVWLVARECLKHDELRASGLTLQARAFEAARRQPENQWTLAMLRESGQVAFDRGDLKTAEEQWRKMLDQILNPPKPAKPKGPGFAVSPRDLLMLLTVAQIVAPQAPVREGTPELTTYSRYAQAVELAKMASERAMHQLSADAVRGALGGGPPVMPIELDGNQNLQGLGQPNGQVADQIAFQVEQVIQKLNDTWTQHKMPPKLAYETLRAVVLPESRPGEVFLYLRPLAQGDIMKPRSLGALLAVRAVEAGEVDDLRRRIEARLAQPSSALPAEVLGIQLSLAMKDEATTIRLIRSLADRLKLTPLQGLAEPVCHAAIPATNINGAEALALPLVESALKTMSAGSNDGQEIIGPLLIAIARRKFKAGKIDEARALLASYIEKMQTDAIRSNPDYFLYWRKQIFSNVAGEFARADQTNDAWDYLGKFADTPISKEFAMAPELGGSLPKALQLLQALPAPERYLRLKAWTMPTKERKSIRLLTCFVPEDPAIPSKFGPMPYVAFEGLADSSQVLIDTAREAGRLDELLDEARKAIEGKVENGKTLLILAQIASGRGSEAREAILARLEELKKASKVPEINPNGQAKPIEWSDYLVARASLADRSLESASENLLKFLIERSENPQVGSLFLSRLRRDQALRRAGREGKLTNLPGPDPGLAYWHPTSLQAAMTHQSGTILPLWVESQGIVSQITGPQSQFLVFDYPLTGKFEITADTYIGDGADGQISYGGLIFQPSSGMLFPVGHHEWRPTTDHFVLRNRYNRTTIQVEPGKLRVLVNGHLFHQETAETSTSPWLEFASESDHLSAFRNLSISGSPEIPREVLLVLGDHLEGWACGFYNESQPPRRSFEAPEATLGLDLTSADPDQATNFDWRAKDGMIVGQQIEVAVPGQSSPASRIYYHRPILDGESISYEFLYEPGRTMAHPTLERLAFLLEPEGIKLHWMTDGETDPDGLEPDNAIDAPEFRKGSGPLPFKPGEWNQASVRFEAGIVSIDLNGTRICEYPLEPANQRIFGFFHDKLKTQAKIRNIVLRGNWPTTLPANLLARKVASPLLEDRRIRGAMIDERFLAGASMAVLAEARKLEPDQRYEKLASYVLPNADHAEFRLEGDLKPTDHLRLSLESPALESPALEAPALDLIASAKGLGKLDEVAQLVEKARFENPERERSRLAMLVLVDLGRGKEVEAGKGLQTLKELVAKISDEDDATHWPELLAASAGLERPALHDLSLAILEILDQKWRKKSLHDWAAIVRPIRARALLTVPTAPRPASWVPVTHADASSRGRGLSEPIWTFDSGVWTHHPGHRLDQLYLTSPLQGNFTVECDLSSFDWRETQLSYAATSVALESDRKNYQLRHFDQVEATNAIDPPLTDIGPWYAFKLVIVDGTYTAWVNGRKIHESRLADESDPWLSVISQGIATGGVRNLKISGNPVIPEALAISAGSNLNGWLSDYYDDSYLWARQGDEIVGSKLRAPVNPANFAYNPQNDPRAVGVLGSKQESVLQYNRPMLEDGEISYEFYYQPGKVMVHPALDRLTFLIDPDGVKIHRMTDAQYDRSGLNADNTTIETDRRRGPANLPLVPDAWNRFKLRLIGDTVSLILNDVVIYERPLEPNNHRDFGLFHNADETEARVRNVRYSGQWPRSLPK